MKAAAEATPPRARAHSTIDLTGDVPRLRQIALNHAVQVVQPHGQGSVAASEVIAAADTFLSYLTHDPAALEEVCKALYRAEINHGVKCFWDGGWSVWIGDDMNGVHAEGTVESLSDAALWLLDNAKRLYPNVVL